ncbi:hypothetical protein BS50DRAFT_577082, partial [Corynespora cassiicola Philippines]
MTGFKFPPPPPPPPKAATNDAPDQYASQRGGQNSGRGDRGRGRGWSGRGGRSRGGGQRGGFGHGDARSDNSRGGRGGSNHGKGPHFQQNSSKGPRNTQPHHSSQSPAPPYPPGTHVNLNFGGQQASPQTQSSVDPMAFAQAMAYMSTPAGMQNMVTFANQMSGADAATQNTQSSQYQTHQSPPQQAGKKRKWNDRGPNKHIAHHNQPSDNAQAKQKPPKAKAAPPPPVPSFGFALPSTPQPSISSTTTHSRQNFKKPNLGLIRRVEDDDEGLSDSTEDVDEEALFAKKFTGEGIVFDHDGESISLQTPAEMAAWIKDRRKCFPTRKRIEEKQKENAEKRAAELEFLRKVSGKKKPENTAPASISTEERDALSAKRKEKLEELRRKVHENMATKAEASSQPIKEKHQAVDLGLGYASDTESDADQSSELDEESSVVSSSEESSNESGSDSDAEDSDAPPEMQSSKKPPAAIKAPPPAPKPVKEMPKNPCNQWMETGKCKFGKRCKYTHPPRDAQTKRKGLYEKLVEQELEKADRLALDAIKFLGRNRFL